MTFRVAVELDPASAKKGATEVKRSLNDLDRAADATERQVKELESQLVSLSTAEKETSGASKQLATQVKELTAAQKTAAQITKELETRAKELNVVQASSSSITTEQIAKLKEFSQKLYDHKAAQQSVKEAETRLKEVRKDGTKAARERGFVEASANRALIKNLAEIDRQLANVVSKNYSKGAPNALNNLSDDISKVAKKAPAASGEVRQLGSQVSDFLIQIQGGVNPLVAITQQGGQIVQAFNPAIGALFTLAGVLGTALLPQLFKSTSAIEDLTKVTELLDTTVTKAGDGTYILTQRITDLAKISKDAAKIQLATGILEAKTAIEKAGKATQDAFGSLADYLKFDDIRNAATELTNLGNAAKRSGETQIEVLDRLGNTYEGTVLGISQLNTVVQGLSDKLKISRPQALGLVQAFQDFNKTKSPETMKELANQVSNLALATDSPNKKLVEFAGKINDIAVATLSAAEKQKVLETLLKDFDGALGNNTAKADENRGVIRDLSQQIASLNVEMTQGGRAAAQYAAQLALGNEFTPQQFQEARRLAGQLYDLQQAQEAAKKADEDAKQASKQAADEEKRRQQVIKELSDSLAVNTLAVADNKREAAQLAAVQKLGEGATAEQTARVRELSGALYDQAAAQQAVKDAEKLRKDVQHVEFDTLSPIQQLEAQEAEKLAILNKYALLGAEQRAESERLITAVAEKGAKDREELSRLEARNTLSATSAGLDALSQIAAQFAGDQDNRNKTAFALSKAFAISSAGLNLALAITQALADPTAITLPQKLANYAAIGTAGAGLIGTITNANYATGGYITGPGSGTSDNVPINASNGEFMINARATARNRGALETINRTGNMPVTYGGINIIVNNNAPVDVTTSADDSGNITLQIDERINQRVPQLLASEAGNPNSKFNQTFKRQYAVKRS